MSHPKLFSQNRCFVFIVGFLLLQILGGCSDHASDVYTVGIVTRLPPTVPAYIGFKEGMAAHGYVEGANLSYLFREVSDVSEALISNTIRELMAHNTDLLLTFEYDLTLQCKRIAEKTDLPILFISNPKPVEMGLVESLSNPGGNLTGIRMPETTLKTIEWITVVIPRAKRIYLPYNPDSDLTATEISSLVQTATGLGLELVLDEIHSVEETIAAIMSLGNDIDVVLRIPSSTLNPNSRLITEAAMGLGIPVFASVFLDEAAFLTFTGDFTFAGKQAARLAHQIRKGTRPSDLPVETSEAFLLINMKMAETMGLIIPQEVLSQAQTIIR